MSLFRLVILGCALLLLAACGDDAEPEKSSANKVQPQTQTATTQNATETGQTAAAETRLVNVTILPENPTSADCLRLVIHGIPARSAIVWKVNDVTVATGTRTELCGDKFKRDDTVSVSVGYEEQGGAAAVIIGNSPPEIVDISSTPEQIFAGVDISVSPVAKDADDDQVDFFYQWLINGEEAPGLTEAVLPGSAFKKGDTIQVRIIANDFFDDGPPYYSYEQQIPNAPPVITSLPPQEITSLDYQYQVEVVDPDDTGFKFRLDEAPEGMSIDESTGLIKWSLVEALPGEHTIAVIATDADGAEAAQEYTLTLSPSGTN